MGSRARPAVYSIPAHRGFADALVAGLVDRYGGKDGGDAGAGGLAHGIILLPTNRAIRAVTEAFVRRAAPGLLLPRLVAVGDPDLGETLGNALDLIGEGPDMAEAIDPLTRQMMLAARAAALFAAQGKPVSAAEALRMGKELGGVIDQLLAERVSPLALKQLDVGADLSVHWQKSLDLFRLIYEDWPRELDRLGLIDMVERRNRLLDHVAARWKAAPPAGFVVAAGVTSNAPALAGLLRTIARMPGGQVVLPDIDLHMGEEEWDSIGPHRPDPESGFARRSMETHPQFHLKLLLEQMGIPRAEVMRWTRSGESDAPPQRSRAISHAFVPADYTVRWQQLDSRERSLSGIRLMEAADSGEEAQAIAILVRRALEEPGYRAALVTPDRELARRVAAHLERWDIAADDSAGRPLSELAPGTLALALAEMLASQFAPVELLTFLKHPLVMAGEGRRAWLEQVRALDLVLRGPRPAPGLAAIATHIAALAAKARERKRQAEADALGALGRWWEGVTELLAPLADSAPCADAAWVDRLVDGLERASSGAVWKGQAGRELAGLLARWREVIALGPVISAHGDVAAMLAQLMADISVRPAFGSHPRFAIYGLLEARLQQADLVICGGLNEGTWPQLPAPDPWLAERIRRELNLPGLERRIGLAAHDLAGAMGAPRVILTRARRDRSGPAIASRFLLRLQAMAGGELQHEEEALALARAIDWPERIQRAGQPAPMPNAAQRRVDLAVTDMDRLKADPFAFYAGKILRLSALERIDADPGAAWRGTMVHDILEQWARHDGLDVDRLLARAEELLRQMATHPVVRALWAPRLLDGIRFFGEEIRRLAHAEGRHIDKVEEWGQIDLGGVKLKGRADRIDRLADGTLAIVDYKTGAPPSVRQVEAGFALQLGLIGLIAQEGGVKGLSGRASTFEYWTLAKNPKTGGPGAVKTPFAKRGAKLLDADNFVDFARKEAEAAIADWITGTAPFTAKLHPEYAPYADYDQLMRLGEWYGRNARDDTDEKREDGQ